MISKNALSSIVILTLLSACSSSSGGGSDATQSFDQLLAQGENIAIKYEEAELTSVSDMPTGGTATYHGVAAFVEASDGYYTPENPEMAAARLRLDANFKDSTIGGEMNNFVDADNARARGSVQIGDGNISGNTFDAKLNGTLTAEGNTAVVDGEMAGAFVGSNADAVAGGISMGLSYPEVSGTLEGLFVAEK